ncbi:transmembrane protein, putative [Medicago truncatula]|uniref:Transmembrane protein, putative n=1 Tax=Medicago truncatula TaxID=3880 RepID=G7KU99_MEDTR|nr:transmembrane protein, putative [Medicago truncatula]
MAYRRRPSVTLKAPLQAVNSIFSYTIMLLLASTFSVHHPLKSLVLFQFNF